MLSPPLEVRPLVPGSEHDASNLAA